MRWRNSASFTFCSRPAIVGSSQSVALLDANFLLTSRTPPVYTHLPCLRHREAIFHREHSFSLPSVPALPKLPHLPLTFGTAFLPNYIELLGFEHDEIAQTQSRLGSAGLTSVAAVPVMSRAPRLKVRSWIVYWIKTRIWLWTWTMCIRRMNAHTSHAASPAIWTPKVSATADHKPASQRLRSARRPCSLV